MLTECQNDKWLSNKCAIKCITLIFETSTYKFLMNCYLKIMMLSLDNEKRKYLLKYSLFKKMFAIEDTDSFIKTYGFTNR